MLIESGPDIRTTAGVVRGLRRAGSTAFLGIPYAEPPVGDLRFQAPVPHRGWQGVRPAVEYGPTPQRMALSEITLIPEPSIPGESTLSVNVFTPSPAPDEAGGLPVLVYIHGGGFVAGSPASPWYDGGAFNRDGIVTVTLSYRLGFDGFGWIADAPHNRAVLDMMMGLEWVQHNISLFGGDPGRVTIAGQSAGGSAVLTLLAMPGAQHLFSAVICLSGAARDGSPTKAEDFGRRLAELGGVEPTLGGLRTLSEARVLELQGQLSTVSGAADVDDPVRAILSLAVDGLTLCPVTDGELIPMDTLDAVRQGIGADKPLVLGTTDHEFNMAVSSVRKQIADQSPDAILTRAGIADTTTRAYLADHPGLDTAGVVGQFVTDSVFRATAVRVARARGNAPTWLYRFSWRSPTFGEAVHCLDVPFFFDCLAADRVSAIAGAEPPQQIADDVHGAAVAFVEDGDPGWPRWSDSAGTTRVFDVQTSDVAHGYAEVAALLAGNGRISRNAARSGRTRCRLDRQAR